MLQTIREAQSMPFSIRKPAGIAAMVLTGALLTGCSTNPETGERRISRTAIGGVAGAVGGYLLGDIVGGRSDRTEKIVGAGIGAVAGAGIGYYLEEQAKELRAKTAGTGVDVTREGDSLVLNMPSGITFDVDSAAVRPQFRATLDEVAGTLARYDRSYVDVYGHTDATGSDAYNTGLSERRAGSVADYLASRGVARARLATRGYGETQPVASNETEDGRAANRRVEIRIVPVTEADVRAAG